MITKKKSFFAILLLISILVFSDCKKKGTPLPSAPVLPTLTTTSITSITGTAAQSGGTITADGGAAVTARGVCWGTAANPTTANSKSTDGSGTGVFSSIINGLTAGVTYYLRAYATNIAGTAYGIELSFSTPRTPVLPNLTTTPVFSITVTTAQSGGNITDEGGAAVTARGVCWSTAANPTTANSKTADGSGIGVFTSSVNGLTLGTTYYVRAYATNSAGTAYGNELSFTTTNSNKDVYVAGYEFSGLLSDVAKVWKNGEASSLTNGSGEASGNSIFVSGTDVYVAGVESNNGSNYVAKVWKNGVPTSLTNGSNDAYANSVYVSGTDVYVAGEEYNGTRAIAKFWKNGVATSLTNGSNNAGAYSVYVSGTDVYVAGFEVNGTRAIAKIWKNGVATSLTNGSNDAYALSVHVSGTDVYVAGQEDNATIWVAKIWKNGVATSLTNGSNAAGAKSIFVY